VKASATPQQTKQRASIAESLPCDGKISSAGLTVERRME